MPRPPSAPLVVLDVNAWKDYFRSDDPALVTARRRFKRAKERGSVRVILTGPLTWELARSCNAEGFDRYATMMRFAWNMSGARVLRPDHEREVDELRHRRRLTEREAFFPPDACREFRTRHMLDEDRARETAAMVARAQDDHEAGELERRAATTKALDEADLAWRDRPMPPDAREAFAAAWARDEMVKVAKEHGLPHQEYELPDPRKLPTFYVAKLVHVHRLHGVLHVGHSPVRTDIFDCNLLQDAAAYADVFVTTDAALRKLAMRATSGLRVLDFRGWDEELRQRVG